MKWSFCGSIPKPDPSRNGKESDRGVEKGKGTPGHPRLQGALAWRDHSRLGLFKSKNGTLKSRGEKCGGVEWTTQSRKGVRTNHDVKSTCPPGAKS